MSGCPAGKIEFGCIGSPFSANRRRDKSSPRSASAGHARERDLFAGLRTEDHFNVRRDSLQSWFVSSWTRWEMVAHRDPLFFDVAAIAMDGYVLRHEAAFIAWAKLEVSAGAKYAALLELSTADELDSSFEREMTVNDSFGAFLHEANIRLPGPIAGLTNYLIKVARQVASGDIDAFDGVQTLRESYAAMPRRSHVSGIGASPGFNFDTNRFNLLANGVMPGTFEVLGRAPAIAQRIRTESADFVAHHAPLEITSDDPNDWPSNWRQR